MNLSVSVRLSSLLLFASVAVVSANAQNHPAPPSGTDLKVAKAQCPGTSTFQPNHLESNAEIRKAATGLAIQIIGRYNADPSKQPDLSNQWGVLDLAIISAADPTCVAKTLTSNKATKTATAQATTAQTNKQVGPPPSSAGSTSAVQKVGIPELLGIAVNNGAVTNNVTGTTMTLSSSPDGFITAFRRDDDTQSNYDKYWLAARIGVSATFNVASSTDALASATRKQASQWQVKGAFRDTSVRSSDVNKLFSSILQKTADAIVSDASSEIFDALYRLLAQPTNTVYTNSWGTSLQAMVSQAPAAADTDGTQKAAGIAKELLRLLDDDAAYQKVLNQALTEKTSNLSELIQKYQADDAAYQSKETEFEKAVADIAKGWNGDILFGQRFPTTVTSKTTGSSSSSASHLPDYLVGEVDITCDPKTEATPSGGPCILGKHTSITGNFSSTFYTNPNAALNEQTFRGAQAALQAQWILGPGFAKIKSANDKSQMTLSLSGSYQRLQENKDQKGKRPDIVLGTITLEIPISGGTSVPFSVSVANASEQVKGTYVKGNFGITFDLDKLASLLKASQ